MSDYRDRHTPIPAGVTAAPDNDDRSSVLTFNPILEANRQPINPDNITTDAPEEPFRLGYIDVICLVLNRMIGNSTSSIDLLSVWRLTRLRLKVVASS